MLYRVEIWLREGKAQPANKPEARRMVGLYEDFDAMTGVQAVHLAAARFGLEHEQYFVGSRPLYVLRVFEQYRKGRKSRGSLD